MDDSTKLTHIEEQLEKVVKAETPWHKYIVQIITLVFLAGGGWVTLSVLKAQAQDNTEKIEKQVDTNLEVSKKLERIETRQEAFKDTVEEIKEDISTQNAKLDKILEEIRSK